MITFLMSCIINLKDNAFPSNDASYLLRFPDAVQMKKAFNKLPLE